MTGRDLIIYILANNLEDEPIVKDGKLVGFMTAAEVATKLNVGLATVEAMILRGMLDWIQIGDTIYISADSVNTAKPECFWRSNKHV